MNKHPFTAMLAAAVFAGFAASASAEEKSETSLSDKPVLSSDSEQDVNQETVVKDAGTAPQVVVQTQDKFLTEMKVYPAF